MKSRVYSEDSRLRVYGLWEASKEQQDEFISFYRSALMALEIYQKVLKARRLLEEEYEPRLRSGDLERIRQDAHTYVEERARCIEAVSDFEGKLSAMLSVLRYTS